MGVWKKERWVNLSLHSWILQKMTSAQLSMTPLMGGQMSCKDKIKEGILIAKEEHNDMADKVMAMLYTLADKFLDGIELDEIKEAMVMTRLGQMIDRKSVV